MTKKTSTSSSSDNELSARCPRPYNLGRRKEKEDKTRRQILEVSATLLIERGGSAFTMDAIAREAAVTRQTVHNQFGTRVGLLEAVCEHVVDTRAFAAMPEVFQQRDPLVGMDLLADIFCHFWQTNRQFVRRLRGLAHTEPELEGMIRTYDERRLSALRGFVERYQLASGEKAARLVQMLFAMTGFEFFEALLEGNPAPESVASELKQFLKLYMHSL